MPRLAAAVLIVLACALLAEARAAERYVEGSDYYRITPPQTTTVPPGKVEVMEVFSYGCPVCNTFQPTMEGLRRVLPANAQIVLLPAAFNPSEDWPMFQRAYITAQLLGVAERAHQGIFDAVWKSGELAITKRPLALARGCRQGLCAPHRGQARDLPRRGALVLGRYEDQGCGCADPRHAGPGHALPHRQRQVPREHRRTESRAARSSW